MSHVENYLRETRDIAGAILESSAGEIDALADALSKVTGRLYCIGLGGGAANASHAAADFRRLCGIDAVCLTDSAASVTAIANDDGWQACLWDSTGRSRDGDALFVMSVGGGDDGVSLPIMNAIRSATVFKMPVFGIVGRSGGYTKAHGDCVIVVPTVAPERITPHTEGWQMVILHCLVSHPKLQKRATKW